MQQRLPQACWNAGEHAPVPQLESRCCQSSLPEPAQLMSWLRRPGRLLELAGSLHVPWEELLSAAATALRI